MVELTERERKILKGEIEADLKEKKKIQDKLRRGIGKEEVLEDSDNGKIQPLNS